MIGFDAFTDPGSVPRYYAVAGQRATIAAEVCEFLLQSSNWAALNSSVERSSAPAAWRLRSRSIAGKLNTPRSYVVRSRRTEQSLSCSTPESHFFEGVGNPILSTRDRTLSG